MQFQSRYFHFIWGSIWNVDFVRPCDSLFNPFIGIKVNELHWLGEVNERPADEADPPPLSTPPPPPPPPSATVKGSDMKTQKGDKAERRRRSRKRHLSGRPAEATWLATPSFVTCCPCIALPSLLFPAAGPRSVLTNLRVRTPGSQGNQMHSGILWTLGIPKMYMRTLGYNVQICHLNFFR